MPGNQQTWRATKTFLSITTFKRKSQTPTIINSTPRIFYINCTHYRHIYAPVINILQLIYQPLGYDVTAITTTTQPASHILIFLMFQLAGGSRTYGEVPKQHRYYTLKSMRLYAPNLAPKQLSYKQVTLKLLTLKVQFNILMKISRQSFIDHVIYWA